MMRIKIKPLDIIIFLIFTAITVFSFISIKNKSEAKPMLIITAEKTN